MAGSTPDNTTFHFYWDANGIRWVGIPGWFHFKTNDTNHYVAISTWLNQSKIPYWERARNDIVDSRIYGVELISPEDARDLFWKYQVKPSTALASEDIARTIVAGNELLYGSIGPNITEIEGTLAAMAVDIAEIKAALAAKA